VDLRLPSPSRRREVLERRLSRVTPAIAPPSGLEVIYRGAVAQVLKQMIYGIVGGQRRRVGGTFRHRLPLVHDRGEVRKGLLV
jgi:hypothetical protein